MAENSRPLNIRLGVKDQEVVARALRELGKDGETALKKLEKASADASSRMKAHRAAAQELTGAFEQMAQRAGPLAPILTRMGAAGTIAAAGIGALSVGLKAAITAAAEAEKVQLRLGAVLQATGGAAGLSKKQLIDYAGELQSSLKINDEAIVESMSVLATFRNVSGDTFKQATVLAADMAAVFGSDLSGASKQLGLALNDPAKGLTALRRAGVTFSEAQKDLIQKLQDTGDLAGAQKVILQELATEIGGAAEAEGQGLAGRTRGLANSWDDMLEAVGNTGPIQSATNAVIGLLEAVTEIAKPESTQDLVAAQERVVSDLQKRLTNDPRFSAGKQRVAEAQEELRLLRQRLALEELDAQAADLKAARVEKTRIAAQKAADEEKAADKNRKDAAADAKRAAEEAARIAKQQAEQRKDALAQIQENIDAIGRETGNLKLNERERAVSVEIQKQEAVARKANIDLTADQIDATRKAALANFDLKESIEAKQKADQDAARAIEDAARKAEDEQKRRAEAAQKIWDNAAENIQDALAGSIRGAFDSNEEGFIKSFFNRMVDLAKDAAAQMAAALIIQPTLGAIGFPGIGGNPAVGDGGGGVLGALSLAGSASSTARLFGAGAGLSSKLFGTAPQFIEAGGATFMLPGTGTAGLLGSGGNILGSAELTSALPYVGAAAAAIGLARGLGIFGPGKSVGPNAGGQLLLGAGGFSLGPTGADNGGNVAGVSSAISQAAELLNALRAVPGLGTQGGGIASYIDTFGAGGITDAAGLVRDVINKGLITGLKESERDILNSASDLGAAIEQVLTAREFPQLIADMLLEKTDPKGAAQKRLDIEFDAYRQIAAAANDNGVTLANIEKLYAVERQEILEQFGEKSKAALSDIVSSAEQLSFRSGVHQSILQIENPRAAALASVESEIQGYRDRAVELKLGVDAFVEIERLGVLRRQEVLRGFQETAARDLLSATEKDYAEAAQAVDAARASLTDSYNREATALRETISRFGEFAKTIRAFRDSLYTGDQSPLSGSARTSLLEAKFFDLANRSRLGEDIDPSELQSAASQFLDAAKSTSKSSLDYAREVSRVYTALDGSAATAQRQADLAAQQLLALNDSVSGLIDIKDGVLSVRDAIERLHISLASQSAAASAQQAAQASLSAISAPINTPPAGSGASAGSGGAYDGRVASLYQNLLDRPPDAAGAAYWTAQLQGAQSYAQVAANIVRSSEFSDTNPGLTGLYQGIFGRAPDAAGAAYWSAQLAAGVPLSEVRENFIRSDEFKSMYGVPAFASGGWADGWSIVGEKGPELVNMRGQVYSNADSRSMLDFGPLAQEIRGLREDQRAQALSIAQLQSRMVKLLDRWEGQGMPPVREAA